MKLIGVVAKWLIRKALMKMKLRLDQQRQLLLPDSSY